VSALTVVEAGTLEEAIVIAEGRDVRFYELSNPKETDEAWIIDDPDGSPQNIHEA